MSKLKKPVATAKRSKAGVIPYIVEDGVVKMMFMEAADAPLSGWQIAKGKTEKGEDKKTTAFREANEELGLFEPNCTHVKSLGSFGGITLFVTEVLNTSQFGDPLANEVSATKWLTMEEFKEKGRFSQRHIVKQAYSIILEQLKIKEVI